MRISTGRLAALVMLGGTFFILMAGSLWCLAGSAEAQQTTSAPPAGAAPAAGPGRGSPKFPEPDPINFDDRTGYAEMFDGATLTGWEGNPDVWKVVDGAIVGTAVSHQTFLVWDGGEPADFEIKLEAKVEGRGADSGVQFRSFIAPLDAKHAASDPREIKWNLAGYQADISFPYTYLGLIGEANGRGILSNRGQVVRAEGGKKPRLIATLGDSQALGGYVDFVDWNQIDLIAHGNTIMEAVNGHLMSVLIDEDPKARTKGLIGLQCSGPAGNKMSFRNLRIRVIQ